MRRISHSFPISNEKILRNEHAFVRFLSEEKPVLLKATYTTNLGCFSAKQTCHVENVVLLELKQ